MGCLNNSSLEALFICCISHRPPNGLSYVIFFFVEWPLSMPPHSTTQKRTLHPVLGSVCVCVCVCVWDSVLSAHSSFCLLCCRSRDADVLGVGVGLETLSASYIIYPLFTTNHCFMWHFYWWCCVEKRQKNMSFTKETYFLSIISFILQPNRHSCCSFLWLCLVLLSQLNTFIKWDEGVCLYVQIYKNKHPFNKNSSPSSGKLDMQSLISVFAPT